MRQLIRILLTFLFLLYVENSCYAMIQGVLEYQPSIDYNKINEKEIHSEAEFYYKMAQKPCQGEIDENTTRALLLYSTLSEMNHQNVIYALKLGSLYDMCEKDRHARGCLDRAVSIAPKRPEPYFYYGEFYYKRGFYKKALDMYKLAHTSGYCCHYETLYKIGEICEKLGDTKTALEFFRKAAEVRPCEELDRKILHVEGCDRNNCVYYGG